MMSTGCRHVSGWLRRLAIGLCALAALPIGARAEDAPAPHDLLNAVLWMQRSVEYKANSLSAFALARLRLDEALADKNWTAAPAEQTGAYQEFPPAVVLDLDETLIDNSKYQVWMVKNDRTFEQATWTAFVKSETSEAIPGALEFARYADQKGVKVFYITNRLTEQEEEPTRRNLERLGFPMGGNVDTLLTVKKKPDWASAKGVRRAYIAKDYRVLLNLGDNFGDFVDSYRGSEAERLKVFEDNRERWGREWIMLANPSYGSFESAPFGHNYKLPAGEQRKAKREILEGWPGP
jgi:5'-nucleotidase (lipoprotein e(P4) family)